jgi:hypothetical protein
MSSSVIPEESWLSSDKGAVREDRAEPRRADSDVGERLRVAEEQVLHLRRALHHSREIGAAIGVLMWSLKVPADEAFDLLRETSMRCNRKIHLVSVEVLETGLLPKE